MPILGRIQASATILLRAFDHRAELAAIELAETRAKAARLAVLFIFGAVTALLGGFAINLLVAAIWWDTEHRILAISLALLAQIGAAAFCFIKGLGAFRAWRPLPLTVDQLKKDSRCLRDLLGSKRT